MMIKTVVDFLTNEECEQLITLINKSNQRSTVVDTSNSYGNIKVDDFRTSSTSFIENNSILIPEIRERIAKFLGIDSKKIEPLQAQKYDVGEYFKPHLDYLFAGEESFNIKQSGNRVYTFIFYLNDDFEGGTTNFPKLNFEIKPKKGMGLFFEGMKDSKPIQESLHEGKPILSGTKYIITAWIRERNWYP